MARTVCQPVTSIATGTFQVVGGRERVSSRFSSSPSAMVSSVAYRKSEATRVCKEAGVASRMVSPFWSKGSRDGLKQTHETRFVGARPGAHLIVVRIETDPLLVVFPVMDFVARN